MYNYNPYLSYYKNQYNYNTHYFNTPTFNPYLSHSCSKIYNFNKVKNMNYSKNEYNNNEHNNNENNTSKKKGHNIENKSQEQTRFSIGNFCITDKGINAFGYHINFDDLIIIFLILFLYFDTDTDLSIIIVLGLMLFNINISSLKNIF